MLLNGINHIALISDDIDRLRAFYTQVFEAEVGPTAPHGEAGATLTMSTSDLTELNVVTINSNREPERQTPMWGRGGRSLYLQAASAESLKRSTATRCGCQRHRERLWRGAHLFFRDPDGLEGSVIAVVNPPTLAWDIQRRA